MSVINQIPTDRDIKRMTAEIDAATERIATIRASIGKVIYGQSLVVDGGLSLIGGVG